MSLVDSAKGPCVQGGAPLIGGRGMIAHAICLWTADALSALEPTPLTRRRAGQGLRGASCRDDESPETALHRGCFVSRRGSGKRLPARQVTLVPAVTGSSHDLRTVVSSEPAPGVSRADRRPSDCTRGPLPRRHVRNTQEIQQPRSLSYLSLTLCCAALHSGWLKGCATPSSQKGRMRVLVADKGIDPDVRRDKEDGGRRRRLEQRRTQACFSSETMDWTDTIFP